MKKTLEDIFGNGCLECDVNVLVGFGVGTKVSVGSSMLRNL